MPILKSHTECTQVFSLSSLEIQDTYHTKDISAYWRTCMLWSTFCKQVRLCRVKTFAFDLDVDSTLPPATSCRKVMFSVMFVILFTGGGGPHKTATWTCSFGDPSSDLLKFVHYVAQTSIAKWALGLWLKGLLVLSQGFCGLNLFNLDTVIF